MGVPAFFRWLTEKYPKVLQDVVEERVGVDPSNCTIAMPFDARGPNPSGLEVDNLYIDMNGIIHPCSHPEDGPQPTTEVEMFENICRYVDRLFRAARPRKLLYLAIDGVAPRAKMNQQRARRFRSAQEAREKTEIEEQVKKGLEAQGVDLPSQKKKKKSMAWDSNVITPGTPFMKNLSDYTRFYVRKRMAEDPAWQKIKVIFSDASVPGEGEHKIMAHVRLQRTQPSYNPNLVHMLHGLDADLIMLALATHEAHFYILREEVVFGRKSAEENERRQEQNGFKSEQTELNDQVGDTAMALRENRHKPLVRLSVPVLREYLAAEFRVCEHVPFAGEVSFERVIDDIVFLCFFVGNDFLPHLPSLDIRDGGLDFLYNVYKRVLPTLGDYVTDHGGQVNLANVDVILSEVGAIEDHVFQMRHETEKNDKERREMFKRRKQMQNKGQNKDDPRNYNNGEGTNIDSIPKVQTRGRSAQVLEGKSDPQKDTVKLGRAVNKRKYDNKKAAKHLKKKLEVKNEKVEEDDDDDIEALFEDDTEEKPMEEEKKPLTEEEETRANNLIKEKVKAMEQDKLDKFAQNVEDKVRLHETGWKGRYYRDKCKADNIKGGGGREHLFRSYIKGLCWVMKYYYMGCASWKWYYPFHYAPFASDLKNIDRFEKECAAFELSTPFSPVEQLLSVLPTDSSHAVPEPSRWLMRDTESPIIDFYPQEIVCDPNGKAMPWLWVVLLPFIDEDRLMDALEPSRKKWTLYEQFCNARGLDDGYLFVHSSHPLFPFVDQILKENDKQTKFPITKSEFNGLVRPPLSNELVAIDEQVNPPITAGPACISSDGLMDQPISSNECLCVAHSEPERLPHRSVLLQKAVLKPPELTESDFRIRRPRLNRGGQTIANLGGGGGYNQHGGGMNVDRNMRNDNNNLPTGMREWGTLEPSFKRNRHNGNGHNNQFQPNLFGRNGGGGRGGGGRGYNNGGRHQQNNFRNPGYQNQGGHGGYNNNNNSHIGGGYPNHPPPSHIHNFPPPPSHPYSQPPPHYNNNNNNRGLNWQPSQPPPVNWNPLPGAPPPSTAPTSNFSFNRRDNASSNQRSNNPTNGVNPQLMSSLRSQLASTLKQNRQNGKRT